MNNTLILTSALAITVIFQNISFAANNSVGSLKSNWQEEQAIKQLKANSHKEKSDVLLSKQGKTRQQVLALKREVAVKQKNMNKARVSANNSNALPNKAFNYHHSFSIYRGYSQLIEDFDGDGYFQTFSVTFDADVHGDQSNEHARVYGELYLSKDGGDWVHYYTTDYFNIYGESEEDEYEVYTTLNQGYTANGYDVLIDLYEEGYDDIVASYSSDDANELYALPLESSNHDVVYVKEYHSESHGHGGTNSLLIIMSLFSVFLARNALRRH